MPRKKPNTQASKLPNHSKPTKKYWNWQRILLVLIAGVVIATMVFWTILPVLL